MAETKHSWTEQELWVVCICYKENLPIDLALRLTNTTNRKSMEMRYQNCLFLEKGKVENALSHPSKAHVQVWEKIEEFYSTQDPLPKEEPVVKQEQPVVKQEESNIDLFFGLMFFIIIVANLNYMFKLIG